MVMTLDQEFSDQGFVWPKIDISEVSFALKKDLTRIHLEGDMPLYKNAKFEVAVEKWLQDSLSQREADFKIAAQLSEREIMESFSFKKEMGDSKAHSSLSEALTVDENNVIIAYNTEFEGEALGSLKNQLRKIKPEFSEESEFVREVQMVYDENYLNWQLFEMFTGEKQFSVTETLLEYWPETWPAGPQAVRVMMSALPWSALFLDLMATYTPQQQIDLRCGFGKNFLSKGNLEENKVSHITFEDDGVVIADLHFGCNIMAFENDKNDMQQLMEFFTALRTPIDDPKWKSFKSFFISTKTEATVTFNSDEA